MSGRTDGTAARFYDRWLEGKDSYPSDDAAAAAVLEVAPWVPLVAQHNRHFLHRAVHYLAGEAGIRQFLDLGVGMPQEPNVHEIAQSHRPDARVVYVDHNPVVIRHCEAKMESSPDGAVEVLQADVREPRTILDAPQVQRTLDFNEPIAVLLVSVLLFIKDDDNPHGFVKEFIDALPSGSYFAFTHATDEFAPDAVAAISRVYTETGVPNQPRREDEVRRFFTENGLQLVEPGLVTTNEWRPRADEPAGTRVESGMWAGVARKP